MGQEEFELVSQDENKGKDKVINGAENNNNINKDEDNKDNNNKDDEDNKDNNKGNNNKGKKKKKKDEEEKPPMVPFFSMFRYATTLDKTLMLVGSIGAALNGAIMPAFSILVGQLNDVFSPEKFEDPNYSLEHEITPIALYFLYIGIAAFILSYFETGFWMLAGERQIRRVRENYLRAVLRQEIGWFDVSKPSEISTKIASDSAVMQEGIGEKLGLILMLEDTATFISGFIVGFVQGWQLTLVILAVSPLLGIAGGFMAVTLSSMTKRGLEAYAGAGGVAEECISNIRTVTTFNANVKESERYTEAPAYTSKLKEALSVGIKKGFVTGAGMGTIMLVMFSTYALAFWYGSTLIAHHTKNATTGKPWTGGDVVTTFFAVVMGAFAIGQAGPSMQAFASGRAAAYKIFSIIDRQSKIDPFDTNGEKPNEIIGDIEFRDVHFNYPSRPEVPILRGLSLSIPRGRTVALVGESGCGKSTTVALLEKFYVPNEGSGGLFLDGRDVRGLNTKWLRERLGLVSQEPQLFATTIAENIRFGKEDATLDEIIEAAKKANAHDFISKFPKAYDTLVGEKGVQMSGGQKQRIAIARAIVKNPAVLLLDEATSALDTENERLVQEALDRMMVGRTTIVIAHRLATVKNADNIVVIKEGKVVEQGKHEELLQLEGLYANLVHKQTKAHEEGKDRLLDGGEKVDVRISQADIATASSDSVAPLLVHSPDPEKGGKVVEKDKPYPFSYSRLVKESRPEMWLVIIGITGALINGAVMPVFAIIYSQIVTTFNKPDPDDVKKGANFLAGMFVCLAVGSGLANFTQISSFGTIGERLTYRLRYYSFSSILRQNIGWFDEEKNATGILATKLATDATLVQGLTTQRVMLIFQNTSTVVAGLVIAFVAGWKLSLVILACMPLVVISSSIQMKFIQGFSSDSKSAYEKAGQVSTEAVGGIRTVASFTNEERLLKMYSDRLEEPTRLGIRKAHVSGIGFGASQFCMFATNCLAFWYGGRLVDQHEWKASASTIMTECSKATAPPYNECVNQVNGLEGFSKMMRVFFAIIMSGMGLGQSSSFAPDAAKASAAASSIYELIDRKSPIDPEQQGGDRLMKVEGNIEFRDVVFNYPTRPNVPIFQGFNLSVPAGKTLALVGDSGGGKSTVISLLERFYDPAQGHILLDGTDIKNLDLKYLRSQISLVSQEPSLFSTTIARNIAYGKEDATLEEIQAAAQMANCHNFIVQLPNGYNTLLGDKYTQLSGGQKQRVAIARAILCNPKVMLLDEATSALDSESETLVQEALERVMKGRTTIVIAHRLSTIMDADVIAVMKGGKIAELGTHSELLALGGVYTNLIKRQL